MKATTSGLNIFRWTTPNMGTGVSFWGEREADRTGFDKERNGDLCARGGEPSAAVGGPARHWRPRGGPGAGALENQFEPARGPSLGSAAAAAHGSLLRRPTAARPTSSHHRRNTTTCRRRRHRRRRRRLRSPSETTAAAARPKSCPSSTIPVSWVAAFFLFVCKPKMHTKKKRDERSRFHPWPRTGSHRICWSVPPLSFVPRFKLERLRCCRSSVLSSLFSVKKLTLSYGRIDVIRWFLFFFQSGGGERIFRFVFYFHCVVLFVFFLSIIDLLSFWAFRVLIFFRSGLDLTGFHQVPMTFFGSCFLIFKSASSLLGFVCDAKGFAYIFRNLGRLD